MIAKGWKLYAVVAVIVVVIILVVYLAGKAAGKNKPLPLPNNGTGIPAGWTATPSAIRLHEAIDGPGTDEDAIFSVLDGKTADMLVAIYNEYKNRYSKDLLDDLSNDLSGDELARATQYFNGII